ncbi:MAG: DmsE family decaheme c-type cytochrome [Gemmatimonadetes bacterium]|nr:DmsE family decaheme c-type cytochrome [Gemmatimonadota bacterium]
MRHLRLATMLAGFIALLAGSGAIASANAQASWTASDCESCHDKALSPAFNKSAHAKISQSCASCHNNVAEHLKAQSEGKDGPVPSVNKVKAADLNAACLSCHETENQASYMSGTHARRNVSCASCHSVHAPKSMAGSLKTKRETDLCFSCHKTERAKSLRPSRHPVREGKMSCSSCHNAHEGTTPKMIKGESVTELCYSCHTEKRGPFLFEHAPVREDCIACHDAHGSNHNRMLTQKAPTLCWNCHLTGSGHFGSGDNYSTEKGVPIAPTGSPSGYPTVNSRFVGRSCMNCHINIHGSNSPSGAYFTR